MPGTREEAERSDIKRLIAIFIDYQPRGCDRERPISARWCFRCSAGLRRSISTAR